MCCVLGVQPFSQPQPGSQGSASMFFLGISLSLPVWEVEYWAELPKGLMLLLGLVCSAAGGAMSLLCSSQSQGWRSSQTMHIHHCQSITSSIQQWYELLVFVQKSDGNPVDERIYCSLESQKPKSV
jgi:hypothetical protein